MPHLNPNYVGESNLAINSGLSPFSLRAEIYLSVAVHSLKKDRNWSCLLTMFRPSFKFTYVKVKVRLVFRIF